MNEGKGVKAARRAREEFEQAALAGIYQEPYAVIRRGKGGSGRTNLVKNRGAEAASDFIDRECMKVAVEALRRWDNCISDERKCRECGVLFKVRPNHGGVCLVCEVGL